MAYAHARGVIHRDLKPSNVMVGSFGEVQVMDWGLAKVLLQGGIADEAAAQPVHETVITTVRSGSAGSGSESQAGSVLGTPAYMAPEQARGEVERIDERADVFGLGAILCEIVTGRPPFSGSIRVRRSAPRPRGATWPKPWPSSTSRSGNRAGSLWRRACLLRLRWSDGRETQARGGASEIVPHWSSGAAQVGRAARVEAQARAEEETKRRALSDELAREAQCGLTRPRHEPESSGPVVDGPWRWRRRC